MTRPSITVAGGRGGVDAHLEDMKAAAAFLDRMGGQVTEIALGSQRYLADPDVAASAVLDPGGAANFESRLLGALDGMDGLLAHAAAVRLHAAKLGSVAGALEAINARSLNLQDGLRWTAGYTFPVWGPAAAPFLILAAVGTIGTDMMARRDPNLDHALERFITNHPGLVQTIFGTAPGTVSLLDMTPLGTFLAAKGKDAFPLTASQGAAIFAMMWPERGHMVLTPLPEDPTQRTPRGLADLMANLAYRGSTADGGLGHDVKPNVPGQFDVQVIERQMPNGTIQRSYIVDIPGTRDFNMPGQLNADLNDQGTNVRAMAGEQTGYERAIEQALEQVGAQPNEPVMLVGHSQGGMVAMRAANDFVTSGKFDVTNVVTAGSPVADMPVPSTVQVLSIQNAYDLVPHLGPHDNPDLPNRTTVTVDQQMGGVLANHSVTNVYEPTAQRLDGSNDPSVRAFLDSAAPFLQGDSSTTHPFQVSRGGL